MPKATLSVYRGYTVPLYCVNPGDMMSVQDPDIMDQCAMVWTIAAYVVANLNDRLPHQDDPLLPVDVSLGSRPALCPWVLMVACIALALIVCRKT